MRLVQRTYLVAIRTDNGTREWVADTITHALEQHDDAFRGNVADDRYDPGEFPLEAKIVRLVESNV